MRSIGLSWIDVLVGVLLMTAIMGYGIHAFSLFYARNQLTQRVDEIKQVMQYTRAQALLRGKAVVLTPLDELDHHWSGGMRLSLESRSIHGLEKGALLHEWRWVPHGTSITWHGFQSHQTLRFGPDLGRNTANGRWVVRNAAGEHSLIVNRLGRVKDESLR